MTHALGESFLQEDKAGNVLTLYLPSLCLVTVYCKVLVKTFKEMLRLVFL